MKNQKAIILSIVDKACHKTIIHNLIEVKVITDKTEAGLIIEEVAHLEGEPSKMTKDKITEEEDIIEVVGMTKGLITTIEMIFREDAEEVFSNILGEVEDCTKEDVDLLPQVQEIHNTKAYHNTTIYVVYVIVKVIMTISVIPSNISSMQCNIKMHKMLCKQPQV